MFQVKLIIFFLIVSVAGGGYVYVQKLRADNATLKINTTKLEGAVEQNEATIKQQTENFERVRGESIMEELIKYLSEKLDVDVSKISATSHLIDDLDSDDWTNLEVIIEVGEKFNRPITDEEADGIETVQDIFDIISN